MAATALTPQAAPGSYGTFIVLTDAAADPVNKNSFVASGNDLIVAHNTDTASHSVTITSAPDAFGRTKDTTFSVAAGKVALIGPMMTGGWAVDGAITIAADAATLLFSVVTL